jgi:hypothetical protein
MELRNSGIVLTAALLLPLGLQTATCSPPPTEDLHVPSPNGQWEAVAVRHYHKDGSFQGYLFKIIELKNHQIINDDTKEKITDDDHLAKSTSFYWSPNGRYLAQYSYVGKIAQSVGVSDFEKGEKSYRFCAADLEHLFEKETCNGIFCYDLEEKPWLNNTDLAINVSYRSKDNQSPYPNITRKVIVRFHDGKWTPLKIGPPHINY